MNNVMGCQQVFLRKAYAKVQSRLENRPRPRLKTLSTTIFDSMEGGKNTGRTDELRFLPFSFPLCLVVCSGSSGSLTPGFLRCCSESEDSIDIELNSENSVQLRLCFLFVSAIRTSHRDSTCCTLSFNCVQVQTLPIAQVTLALTDSFSWVYDSYTHACKARPLTTVGWTSLNVIVIVIASCVG